MFVPVSNKEKKVESREKEGIKWSNQIRRNIKDLIGVVEKQ